MLYLLPMPFTPVWAHLSILPPVCPKLASPLSWLKPFEQRFKQGIQAKFNKLLNYILWWLIHGAWHVHFRIPTEQYVSDHKEVSRMSFQASKIGRNNHVKIHDDYTHTYCNSGRRQKTSRIRSSAPVFTILFQTWINTQLGRLSFCNKMY